jgi:hypothetical protein
MDTVRPPSVAPEVGWRNFCLGALAGLLVAGALVVIGRGPWPGGGGPPLAIPAPAETTLAPSAVERREAERRLQTFLASARLSDDERRRLRAVLVDAGQTRAAALAYFASMDAAGPSALTAAEADELDALLEGDLEARLTQALGPVRGPVAEHRLQPLAPLAALDPAALPR